MRHDQGETASTGTSGVATVEKKRVWRKPTSSLRELPAVRTVPAWLVSLIFHTAAIIGLVLIPLYLPVRNRVSLSIVPMETKEEIVLPQDFHYSADAHEKVGAMSEHGLEAARASAPVEGPVSKIEYSVKAPTPTRISDIQVHNFNQTVLQGPNL